MTARVLAASLSLVAALACERGSTDAAELDRAGASTSARASIGDERPSDVGEREPGGTGACGSAADEGAERGPASATPTPREPVAVTPVPGADQPGPVLLVVASQGLVRLDEAGARVIGGKLERHVQALFVGPDGGVYLVDASRLAKLDGDRLVELERFDYDTVAPVEDLALGPDGTAWVVGGRGAGPRVDGRWQLQTLAALGLGYSAAIEVGHDRTAWLFGGRQVLRRPAGADAWERVELDALATTAPLLLHPSASPSGAILATDGHRLVRFTTAADAPELTSLAEPGAASTEPVGRAYTAGLALASDGTVAVASGDCRLVRLGPDGRGQAWRRGPSDTPGYPCRTLEAMAVDASGRVWVAAREGLSVVGPAAQVVHYPLGSFPALAGRVGQMLAVGRGPATLPPVPTDAELGRVSLSGAVTVDGKRLADAPIEACPSVALVSGGSPCAQAELRHVGVTDASGRFRLEGVAIGDYGFAVEVAGQWRWTTPPSFAAALEPGGAHELGTLEFAPL